MTRLRIPTLFFAILSAVVLAFAVGTPEDTRPSVPETLRGFERIRGSTERGRAMFLSDKLYCTSCHSVQPGGESEGPSLVGVGSRLSRDQLVSSILEPSRDIVPGFGTVRILTTRGRVHVGTIDVEKSTPSVLVLKESGGLTQIERSSIESMGKPESPMPSGQVDELTPQEFADLLAYLGSLRRQSAPVPGS